MNDFQLDLEQIRTRARAQMAEGAVTGAYRADPHAVVRVLNEVLATEIVCVLRYSNHYYMARGMHSESVAKEFREHARDEQDHADRVAERITQLGGDPNLDPEGLHLRSHAEYRVAGSLGEMIREDLVAERVAIETYSEIVRWLGEGDPTTRRLMESILEKEEEHADDLASLLEQVGS